MFQNLFDHGRVFDASVRRFGNDFDLSTAAFTLLDIKVEDTLDPLHQDNRSTALLIQVPSRMSAIAELYPFYQLIANFRFQLFRDHLTQIWRFEMITCNSLPLSAAALGETMSLT